MTTYSAHQSSLRHSFKRLHWGTRYAVILRLPPPPLSTADAAMLDAPMAVAGRRNARLGGFVQGGGSRLVPVLGVPKNCISGTEEPPLRAP